MQGKWIRRKNTDFVAIFIHGLFSSSDECWKNDNDITWPDLLSENLELEKVDIFSFEYYSDPKSKDYSISDIVDALKEQLKNHDILCDGVTLFFVCHSMGGIVARKYIVEQQLDLYIKNIRTALFLIASPSLGSEYANWAEAVFKEHSQIKSLKIAENNPWLSDLDKTFFNLEKHEAIIFAGKELIEDKKPSLITLSRGKRLGLKIYCFFKKDVSFEKKVVTQFSGRRYFSDSITIAKSDHFSIAKPQNKQAPQHEFLCAFIKDNFDISTENRKQITFHGSKYHCPGGDIWWDALITNSSKRFYLIGATNKSWLNRRDEDKKLIAKEMLRILMANGKVRILFTNKEKALDFTKEFIDKYLKPLAKSKSYTITGDSFTVVESKKSNYNAVVSDNKLILMPLMNDAELYQDLCMVLEVDQNGARQIFNNYIDDIEKFLDRGSSIL